MIFFNISIIKIVYSSHIIFDYLRSTSLIFILFFRIFVTLLSSLALNLLLYLPSHLIPSFCQHNTHLNSYSNFLTFISPIVTNSLKTHFPLLIFIFSIHIMNIMFQFSSLNLFTFYQINHTFHLFYFYFVYSIPQVILSFITCASNLNLLALISLPYSTF